MRWGLGLVLYAVVYVAARSWLDAETGSGWFRNVAFLGLLAILFAIGMLQWRSRLGGRGQVSLLRRSLREGRVVEGADVERWSVEIPRRTRYMREIGRPGVWACGLLTAITLLAIVLLAATAEVSAAIVFGVFLAGLVALNWWIFLRLLPRRRERFLTLEQDLRRRT